MPRWMDVAEESYSPSVWRLVFPNKVPGVLEGFGATRLQSAVFLLGIRQAEETHS